MIGEGIWCRFYGGLIGFCEPFSSVLVFRPCSLAGYCGGQKLIKTSTGLKTEVEA
jgi:hypothetical protein